jgi:hypothetical protein
MGKKMENQWYLARGKERLGPFTTEQMWQMIAAGRIGRHEMVLRVGEKKWCPMSSVRLLSASNSTILRLPAPVLGNRRMQAGFLISVFILFVSFGLFLYSRSSPADRLAAGGDTTVPREAPPLPTSEGTSAPEPSATELKAPNVAAVDRPAKTSDPVPSAQQPIEPKASSQLPFPEQTEEKLEPKQEKKQATKNDPVFEKNSPSAEKGDSSVATPKKEGTPAEIAKKEQPKSAVDLILKRLYAPDSNRYTEKGFVGLNFGSSYDSLKSRLKKSLFAEQAWLQTDDGVYLIFNMKKLAGVTKYYRASSRDNFDALVERFGKPISERTTHFASVRDRADSPASGEQTLIRYCFDHSIVYGYISTDFMSVTVFDRNYVEDVIRRDVIQKERLLSLSLPVVMYAFGDSLKWEDIPFPKMDGTQSSFSVNNGLKKKLALLEGRSAPQAGSNGNLFTPAIVVYEQEIPGAKHREVKINFNSFPSFERHPLTSPYERKDKSNHTNWVRSEGSWNVEHDAQLCNMILASQLFPPAMNDIAVSTVANGFGWRLAADFRLPHMSFNAYNWDTIQGYTVSVLGNNSIAISKRERRKID